MDKVDEYERLSLRLKGLNRLVDEVRKKLDGIWFDLTQEEIEELRHRRNGTDPVGVGKSLVKRYLWLSTKIANERAAGPVAPEREAAVSERLRLIWESLSPEEQEIASRRVEEKMRSIRAS